GRLVVARAGADVEHRARVAEPLPDRRRDPRVGGTGPRVGAADDVVAHASSERRADIRRTTSAAWRPVSRWSPPERASACSMLSTGRAPNAHGTPVRSWTSWVPRAASG